jgi:hypothetical protein
MQANIASKTITDPDDYRFNICNYSNLNVHIDHCQRAVFLR